MRHQVAAALPQHRGLLPAQPAQAQGQEPREEERHDGHPAGGQGGEPGIGGQLVHERKGNGREDSGARLDGWRRRAVPTA